LFALNALFKSLCLYSLTIPLSSSIFLHLSLPLVIAINKLSTTFLLAVTNLGDSKSLLSIILGAKFNDSLTFFNRPHIPDTGGYYGAQNRSQMN